MSIDYRPIPSMCEDMVCFGDQGSQVPGFISPPSPEVEGPISYSSSSVMKFSRLLDGEGIQSGCQSPYPTLQVPSPSPRLVTTPTYYPVSNNPWDGTSRRTFRGEMASALLLPAFPPLPVLLWPFLHHARCPRTRTLPEHPPEGPRS
ncbi:hypothetical protein B0T16DRAFT_401403 [Cercophora newfieldiana]|uniref:Uncharacterized protein n=1 Tax=Cercophora newfieldiana TaxID=92897 RepID=A0AA39YTS6_9PEZI|nr:hypothetical protein B0T16DRAFT_401403 [Cercophora newfieldiana]